MADQVINGNTYDYSSIEINVRGRRYLGITEVSYSDSLEPGEKRGAHAQPLAFTRGEYSSEASVTMGKDDFYEMLADLGSGYMEVVLDTVSVTYAEEGQPTKSDEIVGARITSVEDGHSQGSDALTVSLELKPHFVRRDGKTPLRTMLGGNS